MCGVRRANGGLCNLISFISGHCSTLTFLTRNRVIAPSLIEPPISPSGAPHLSYSTDVVIMESISVAEICGSRGMKEAARA